MQTLHMNLTKTHGWHAFQWLFITFVLTPEKWQRLPSRSEDELKEGSLATIKTVQGIASNYTARVTENSKVRTLTFELSLPSSLSYSCWRLMPCCQICNTNITLLFPSMTPLPFILYLFCLIQFHLLVPTALLFFLDSLDWMESQIRPMLGDILSLCDTPKMLPCDFGLIGNWKGTLGALLYF